MKKWLISGCSSGFGRAIAMAALKRGDRVAAAARRLEDVADLADTFGAAVRPTVMDVTSPEQVRAALDGAVRQFGGLEVLVNAAGYGLQGAIEDVTDPQIRQIFETNVFGLFDVVRAALPHLRKQGKAHIVNFSSIGGRMAVPLVGLYSATKFAVEGFSEALAGEVAPQGIRVTIIEPGAFATHFARSVVEAPTSAPYAAATAHIAQILRDLKFADPTQAANIVLKAVDSPDPPLRLVLGEHALGIARDALVNSQAELERWQAWSIEATSGQ